MLNLSGTYRYYLCTDLVTLRYRHRGIREYITSQLHRDPVNGDVYIFLSRDYSRVRIYYYHNGGEILSEKVLHGSRFMRPIFEDVNKRTYHISWEDFVYLLEGIIRKDKNEFFNETSDD